NGSEVQGGTLQIDSNGGLSSGDVTIDSGATLAFNGNLTVANNIHFQGQPAPATVADVGTTPGGTTFLTGTMFLGGQSAFNVVNQGHNLEVNGLIQDEIEPD